MNGDILKSLGVSETVGAIDFSQCEPCKLDKRRNLPEFIDLAYGESLCLEHALIVTSWMVDGNPDEPLSWRAAYS